MSGDIVEFRAGNDNFGQRLWVVGSVVAGEDREDGSWVNVLPAHSGSEHDSQWVRAADVRPARR